MSDSRAQPVLRTADTGEALRTVERLPEIADTDGRRPVGGGRPGGLVA
ncbi:hypothetical protein [Streptomyces griseochromogenes]